MDQVVPFDYVDLASFKGLQKLWRAVGLGEIGELEQVNAGRREMAIFDVFNALHPLNLETQHTWAEQRTF